MHVLGRGVEGRPLRDDRGQIAVVIDRLVGDREIENVLVDEHGGFAGFGQDDELVAVVAADRACLGAHRDRSQAHAGEDAEIGHEHPVVGQLGTGLIDIEGVGILHQEFAAAHHAEARALLVTELPLDVIKNLRQFAIRSHRGAKDFGDHVLVCRPVQQLALVSIDDAQHFRPVGVVAPGLAPEIGKLQGRHQQLDGAGAIHLLPHDLLDLLQHPQAERQPRVDAGGFLADHASTQHQAMRNDLRFLGIVAENRQEIFGQAHRTLDLWDRAGLGHAHRSGNGKLSDACPHRCAAGQDCSPPPCSTRTWVAVGTRRYRSMTS